MAECVNAAAEEAKARPEPREAAESTVLITDDPEEYMFYQRTWFWDVLPDDAGELAGLVVTKCLESMRAKMRGTLEDQV